MQSDTASFTKGKERAAPEKLDVEDDEARESRIRDTLDRLNIAPDKRPGPDRQLPLGDPSPDLLARVQAFLPEIAKSNTDLEDRQAVDIDIEHLDASAKQYIQMDLGLGVFEHRKAGHGSASDSQDESESGSSGEDDTASPSSQSASSSDESSDDSGDDSDSEVASTVLIPRRPTKPLPKRARAQPKIVVLGESSRSASLPPP